jgi:hypothetical protein
LFSLAGKYDADVLLSIIVLAVVRVRLKFTYANALAVKRTVQQLTTE